MGYAPRDLYLLQPRYQLLKQSPSKGGSKKERVMNVTIFLKDSIENLGQLAEQGDLDAQVKLGDAFYYGTEEGTDYKKSAHYFALAANQKDYYSMGKLGALLLHDKENKDIEKAREYLLQAAQHGDMDAMNSLGNSYDTGVFATDDTHQAAYWYEKAAQGGSLRGQFNIANLYDYGLGVTQNHIKAVEWYSKASDQGCPQAKRNLAIIFGYKWAGEGMGEFAAKLSYEEGVLYLLEGNCAKAQEALGNIQDFCKIFNLDLEYKLLAQSLSRNIANPPQPDPTTYVFKEQAAVRQEEAYE